MNHVHWPANDGFHMVFAFNAAERIAYCYVVEADAPSWRGQRRFYTAPCSEDPESAKAFNALRWREQATNDLAAEKWNAVNA